MDCYNYWLAVAGWKAARSNSFLGLLDFYDCKVEYSKTSSYLQSAEQKMDGEALMVAFGTCSGPDCIKDDIRPYGTRLKVYNVIKAAIGESYELSVCSYAYQSLLVIHILGSLFTLIYSCS